MCYDSIVTFSLFNTIFRISVQFVHLSICYQAFMKMDVTVQAGLHIYCADRKKSTTGIELGNYICEACSIL